MNSSMWTFIPPAGLATPARIHKLISGPIALQGRVRCAICFEPVRETARTDSCSHVFCFPCLSEWAKEKECPICASESLTILSFLSKKPGIIGFENHYIPTSTGLMNPCAKAQKNSLGFLYYRGQKSLLQQQRSLYIDQQFFFFTSCYFFISCFLLLHHYFLLHQLLLLLLHQYLLFISCNNSSSASLFSSSPAAFFFCSSIYFSSASASSSLHHYFLLLPAASASNSNSINVVPNQSVHLITKNVHRSGQRPVVRFYNLRERLHPRNSRCTQVRLGQTVFQLSLGNDSMPTHRSVISSSSAASTSPVSSSSPAAASFSPASPSPIVEIIESEQYSTDEEESSDETSSDEEESSDETSSDEEESSDETSSDEEESADESYYVVDSADDSYYEEESADETYYEVESAD
ncbi:hypothetical protein CEXT_791051 [Caerostris extrusa]|uniref:RING-type domain-containing protein n=1 Tax=Caerostris extrusa TaxID=172846 RepID=A0AAV4Y191_CAEEX|nr:hypothetical protein CEXT_791051 [Caerostris extrusa]